MTAPARPAAPGWTEANESDPGVTLLQLFAFLAAALALGLVLRRRRTTRAGAGRG